MSFSHSIQQSYVFLLTTFCFFFGEADEFLDDDDELEDSEEDESESEESDVSDGDDDDDEDDSLFFLSELTSFVCLERIGGE